MRFLSVRAQNFMSFRVLDYIYPQTGLYFVGGEVQGSCVSSSNRAGKSVFSAETLSWGLFGKTIRGLIADAVMNRDVKKDCFVEIIVEDDGGQYYIVKRYRKHNEHQNSLFLFKGEENITGADVNETQKKIDSILGTNWLVFSTAIIFGEKAKRFIEAYDTEKKEIFDEIMMFQSWLVRQQAVAVDLKVLVGERTDMEGELNSSVAASDEVIEELKTAEDSISEIAGEKEGVLEVIEKKTAEVVRLKKDLEKAKSIWGEAEGDLKILKEENDKIYGYVNQLRQDETKEMGGLREITSGIFNKLSPIAVKIMELQGWLDNKEDLQKGTRCKICGNEISDTSVEGVAIHYNKELEKLFPKRDELEAERETASEAERSATKKWQEKLKKAEKTKEDLDIEMNNQRGIIREREGEALRIENNITVLKGEIEHLDSSFRDREKMLLQFKERLEGKIFDYREKIKGLTVKIKGSEEEYKYLQFWKVGFGSQGIKSLLLDEILPSLNTKVAYYSSVLMDSEISVEFDTETTLKSGETRDKFDIKLVIDGEDVDYKSCSSGEKGRIDAAILLALQNLIFERATSASNLVIFDEIFEHMDSTGIERVIGLLNEEAKDKAIFVISHQNEFSDFFDNILMIKKDKNGSRLVA